MIAIANVNTLIAQFTVTDVGIINTVTAVVYPGTVITIFTVVRRKNQITIFIAAGGIAVGTVFHGLLLLQG
jgi:hypothetical protein